MKYKLIYSDEIKFKKIEKCLEKYNKLAYHTLFQYYEILKNGIFYDNSDSENIVCIVHNELEHNDEYKFILPSDKLFTAVYGELALFYRVYYEKGTILLSTITPTNILIEGGVEDLKTYKGVIISKSNDNHAKFKIDLLNMIKKH